MKLKWYGKLALLIVGIVYFGLLYKLLLTPARPTINHIRPVNLIPMRTILQNLTGGGTTLRHRAYELLGNMAVFTPLSAILALIRRRFSIWPILSIGIVLSTTVEVTQYLCWTWRVADVDDVICNVSGALIAYVILVSTLHLMRVERFPSLRRSNRATVLVPKTAVSP